MSQRHASNQVVCSLPANYPNSILLLAAARATCALALFAVMLMGSCLFAQTAGTASIQGAVTDTTGALVPHANVTYTNTGTGASRTTVSDGAGLYSLPNLPVGAYTLTVTVSGMQSFRQSGVLEVGNSVQISPALSVGSTTQTIEVQATGNALEMGSSTFKQVIDQKEITQLPLNGRQATQLILISGGAVNAPATDISSSKNYANTPVIAVAGSQGNFNNYVLDGGSHTDTFTNTNLPYPFPDALHEFSVESNSLPARNGLHPGSLVNVVTNSGTNEYHGTLFEYIRNNIINANNFFSTSKDTLKRNQFGGTLGGHILTNKLFFFGGYQGTRNRQVNNSAGYCIPTPAELSGDFSHMGGACPVTATNIVDPVTGVNISATRKLPATSISAQALALAATLPSGLADAYGRVNLALPANSTEDQYIGRVDWTVSSRHTLFGRYFITDYAAPAYFSPTNLLLTTSPGNDERVQTFTLGDTFILTPHLVNTFHGTYARRRDDRGPTAGGINASNIGVNIFPYAPYGLQVSVKTAFSVGCGTCSPGFYNTNTEDFSDDVDYVKGKHQIAFGGEILRTGENTQGGFLENGVFTFGGLASGVNGAAGEPMVDFIAGRLSNNGGTVAYSQSRAQKTTYRETVFGVYAQDTYRPQPKLTISLGVRWEPEYIPQDKFHRGSTFSQTAFTANQHSTVFPNAPAGSLYYGDAGVTPSFSDDRYANISPRAGITFDPYGNGNTIFRAGGAIMYDTPGLYTYQRVLANAPYTNEIDLSGTLPFQNPWASYPGGNPFPLADPPAATTAFPTSTLYVVMPRNLQTPTVNQWTASVEQNLGRGWTMSITYLGNKTNHLYLGQYINSAKYIPGVWTGAGSCGALTVSPGTGKACSSTANTNQRTILSLINPTQGAYYTPTMTSVSDGGSANYNGLLAVIQHRLSNSFSLLSNYTWSHCISVADDPGDVSNSSFENAANPGMDRSNCGSDVRHIFNTSLVASSRFSRLHGIEGAIVNGWQVAPLIRLTSGLPINVTSGIDNSLTGAGNDRPNLLNANAVYSKQEIFQKAPANVAYLVKAAFSQNATGTYGNLGRNAFRAPNYYDLDVSINRSFPIRDRLSFNLRLESFNALNHPNFSSFATNLSSSTFGNATAANDPRLFQAAGRFTF